MNIALALILHPTDGTILIAQRKADAHLGGLWEFPGGKCLDGETAEDCAVRETHEETGLDVVILESWPVMTHVYAERTVTLHPFLCQAQSVEAQAQDSQQVLWVHLEQLGEYPFPEANQPLLLRLQQNTAGLPGNAGSLPLL